MPKININDAEYYYEIHGTGHPLILIAGYTQDHASWLPILRSLTKHFKVVTFDSRGTGQTKDEGAALSADLIADDIIGLIKHLGLERPHIIGQSMGGAIAQSIASRYNEFIDHLVLSVTVSKWRQAILLAFKSHLVMREKELPFDDIFDAVIPWVYGERILSSKEEVGKLKKIALQNPNPLSLANQKRQFRILETFNGTENLSKITSPTLVIYATEDIIVLPSEVKAMASKIPNSELSAFPCGHNVVYEMPNETIDTYLKFLVNR